MTSRPRWKLLVELAFFIVLMIWGAWMFARGVDGEEPRWLLIGGGVLVFWVNIRRVEDRWNQL